MSSQPAAVLDLKFDTPTLASGGQVIRVLQADALDLTFDTSKLTSSSQLISLLQGDAKPVFQFGTQIAPYSTGATKNAPNGTSASITVSGSGNWKTSTGIGFSLSGSAKGELKIVTSGAVITYAPDLESKPTGAIPAASYDGSVYIVVSLDFQISGSVSGSGNAGAIGISGNINGSAEESVTFCHKVSGDTVLSQAVADTFKSFSFALEPASALSMLPSDATQVNFAGSLAFNLSASYGIDTITFAAPGVASVLDSVAKGNASLTFPSGKIDIGAKASVAYTHSDAFTVVVERTGSGDAFLYVMRADKTDLTEGTSISAAVTITNTPGVTVNAQTLQQTVNGITGGVGGAQAATAASDIAQGLTTKLNNWITSTVKNGATLGLTWDQSNNQSLLFKYQVDLSSPSLATQSWQSLCRGNFSGAESVGGLIPLPGSGISQQTSDSFTAGIQLFNFFAASSKNAYFNKTNMLVTPTGDLQYTFDVGAESDTTVQQSSKTCQIHFVADVNGSMAGKITKTDISMQIEVKAVNDQKEAGRIGDLVGLIPPNAQVNQAQKAMQAFVSASPNGTVDLICVLEPSAWARLSCSEYQNGRPPANQQQDMENWNAFRDGCANLIDSAFGNLTYGDWQRFNVAAVYGPDASGVPDRRSTGAWTPGPFSNFFLNSQDFMNLSDDLHSLAGLTSVPNSSGDDARSYSDMLDQLASLVIKRDVSTAYAKPTAAALLKLSNPSSVANDLVSGKNSLTCTLTLS